MNRTEKTYSSAAKKADAQKDIALINQFSVTELKPDDVYCFSVILCDNEVDRDKERFTDATLEQLAKLFVGKTGIIDHQWSAKNQVARLYRVEVETPGGMNTMGQPLKRLRGSAYMSRNENTAPIISLVDAGIMKEISVSVSIGSCNCSICGNPFRLDLDTFKYRCVNDHVKGERTAGGELCVGNLENPTDAYEFSFVAVPAQPGAGVTKTAKKGNPITGMTDEEMEKRRQIYQEAKKTVDETVRRAELIKFAQNERNSTMTSDKKSIVVPRIETLSSEAKAAFYRAAIAHDEYAAWKAAKDYTGLGALPENNMSMTGGALIPRNLGKEIVTAPIARNSLRRIEHTTYIRNQEEAKLLFNIIDNSVEDITDEETAQEIELSGDSVSFGSNNKIKVCATVSDTVYYLVDSEELSRVIDTGLRSSLELNEKQVAFAQNPESKMAHMSFYKSDIKEITGADLIQAIMAARNDLAEVYSDNATCVMRRADYYAAIPVSMWGYSPEVVLDMPVVFCDFAVTPVVGDFDYSRTNYSILVYDVDKKPVDGKIHFVLTAWYDRQILIKSAFRLAKVATSS